MDFYGENILGLGGAAGSVVSFFTTLNTLGLTSGLQSCIDANDLGSYAGGTQLVDTSGNSHSWWLGFDSGTLGDPDYIGAPGDASSYFTFPHVDYFKYAGANSDTWVNALHKDNATFTLLFWLYVVTSGFSDEAETLFATGTYLDEIGCYFIVRDDTAAIEFKVVNGDGSTTVMSQGSTSEGLFANTNAWNMIAVTQNEATGTMKWYVNGNTATNSAASTYTSPSASNITAGAYIGSNTDREDAWQFSSGVRFGIFAAWDRVLSTAEISSIYNATKTRFGLT